MSGKPPAHASNTQRHVHHFRRPRHTVSLGNNANAWRVPGQDLPAQHPFSVMPMEYKGYRIEIGRVGKGWRASIFSPGSKRPLPDSPSNLEKSREEEIVAEAKRIIDARLSRQVS